VVALVCGMAALVCGMAALVCGMKAREASAVAVLMNTRGLVELIVLNIGLKFNVLNSRAFSILVLMCLFTTFITCPLLQYIYPLRVRKFVYAPEPGELLDEELGVGRGADHLHSHSSGDNSAYEYHRDSAVYERGVERVSSGSGTLCAVRRETQAEEVKDSSTGWADTPRTARGGGSAGGDGDDGTRSEASVMPAGQLVGGNIVHSRTEGEMEIELVPTHWQVRTQH
jgi:hypothetical protein